MSTLISYFRCFLFVSVLGRFSSSHSLSCIWSDSRRLDLLVMSLPCVLGRSSACEIRCCEITPFLSLSRMSDNCELPDPWEGGCGTEGAYSPASKVCSRLIFLRLETLLGSLSSFKEVPFSLSLSSTLFDKVSLSSRFLSRISSSLLCFPSS